MQSIQSATSDRWNQDRTGYRSGLLPERVKHHMQRLRRLDGRIESDLEMCASVRIWSGSSACSHAWGTSRNAAWQNSSRPFRRWRGFVGAGAPLRAEQSPEIARMGRECARIQQQNLLCERDSWWSQLSHFPKSRYNQFIATSLAGFVPYSRSATVPDRVSGDILSSWRDDIPGLRPRDARGL